MVSIGAKFEKDPLNLVLFSVKTKCVCTYIYHKGNIQNTCLFVHVKTATEYQGCDITEGENIQLANSSASFGGSLINLAATIGNIKSYLVS